MEKSKNLRKLQKNNLNKFNVKWINNLKNFNKKNCFILSNELLDAFPVKHLKKIQNKWYERYIFYNKTKKEPSSKFLILKKTPNDVLNFCNKNTNFIEYAPEIFKFISEISKLVKNHKNNCFMTIDYGYYDENFRNTLQALEKHQKVDIFYNPGNVDITHLVNFKFINRIFEKNSLTRTLNMSQSDFLIKNGILARLKQAKKNLKNKQDKIKLDMSVNRLIDKKQMGNLFKVLLVTNEN
jgi:SAM-dependent MidA family methyltransferase